MTKPTYNRDDFVCVQKVGGGVVEVRGKLAGDIEQLVADETLINLSAPGFHVYGVVSGGFVPPPNEQVTLPLDDPQKSLKLAERVNTLLANVQPAPEDLEAFRKILQGQTIECVSFDDATGMWCLFIGPGEGKPGKRHRLEYITAQLRPMKDPTESAPESDGGLDLDMFKPAESAVAYLDLIGAPHLLTDPHNYNNVIVACLLDFDDGPHPDTITISDRAREADRWFHLHKAGCDDKELLVHISECFGGKAGRTQKLGEFSHMLVGDKKKPTIIYCADVDDKELPGWVKPGDRETVLAPGQPTGNGLVGVRELMHIPGLLKKETKKRGKKK